MTDEQRPTVTRLPALGPRGEGWVAIQFVLLGAIVLAGPAAGRLGGSGPLAATSGALLLAGGLLLAGRGLADLGRALTPLPRPRDGAALVDRGAYGLVRHPIYGGLILVSIGWALAMGSLPALGLSALLLAFLDLKARREEAWLVERFAGYAAYRRRRRRLIPWVY